MRPIEELGLSEVYLQCAKSRQNKHCRRPCVQDFSADVQNSKYRQKNCIEISKAMAKFGVKFVQDDALQPQQIAKNSQNNDEKREKVDARNGKNAQQNFPRDKSQNNLVKSERKDNKSKKQKSENDSLNEYLSKLYAGMTWAEIIMGKRQRPIVEKIERPPLTEKSLVKFCRKGKWGYKDWKGNVIVPPSYEEAFGFLKRGLA